ncbi:LexA family protein [Neptunomonas qingdaonensis]|uniref:DNA polymerase V n=2 Tax=Neptunomonas TaxID=75687 RepID=A0A1I2QK96_9GAMM|nr:S24 family peptidase [Neptunomonas qingdaonensis]SFG29025.1 DNA polymerase V [Neptunomonas qingdaonensis]
MMLPFIPLRACAGITGFESPAAEYTELRLTLDQILIDDPAATYLGFVEGTSMKGVGIFPNDILVVSRAETVINGDVIVATLNGGFVCKIADIKQKRLVSSSPGCKDYQLSEGDEFIIEGVVTRSVRFHRPLKRGLF